MRIEYNKLVRDNIPNIIQETGKTYEIRVMGDDEYRNSLLEKLVEEANEVRDSLPDNLATELADLLEVFDAIVRSYGLSNDELLIIKERRRKVRGGFDDRLKLLWIDTPLE
jgi:predicted house-cleaning noncanonical NTP pyrophosphatase (MazG superfamily)